MWPSAVVLSRWIATNPSILYDSQQVLELGAGCGLVGLLASRILHNRTNSTIDTVVNETSSTVLLSDFNPCVLENLKRNILLNSVSSVCSTCGLDFYQQGEASDDTGEHNDGGWLDMNGVRHTPVDVVLGADIICQPSDAVAASRTIWHALTPGGRAYIVCATSAHRFGVDVFPTACAQMGLKIEMQNVANLYQGALLTNGLEQTTGYVSGMELTMFTIEKPQQ